MYIYIYIYIHIHIYIYLFIYTRWDTVYVELLDFERHQEMCLNAEESSFRSNHMLLLDFWCLKHKDVSLIQPRISNNDQDSQTCWKKLWKRSSKPQYEGVKAMLFVERISWQNNLWNLDVCSQSVPIVTLMNIHERVYIYDYRCITINVLWVYCYHSR